MVSQLSVQKVSDKGDELWGRNHDSRLPEIQLYSLFMWVSVKQRVKRKQTKFREFQKDLDGRVPY